MRFNVKIGLRRAVRVEKKRRQRSMTNSAAPIVDSIMRKVTALSAAPSHSSKNDAMTLLGLVGHEGVVALGEGEKLIASSAGNEKDKGTLDARRRKKERGSATCRVIYMREQETYQRHQAAGFL